MKTFVLFVCLGLAVIARADVPPVPPEPPPPPDEAQASLARLVERVEAFEAIELLGVLHPDMLREQLDGMAIEAAAIDKDFAAHFGRFDGPEHRQAVPCLQADLMWAYAAAILAWSPPPPSDWPPEGLAEYEELIGEVKIELSAPYLADARERYEQVLLIAEETQVETVGRARAEERLAELPPPPRPTRPHGKE